MGMTTLHGRGAITISDDRQTYRSHNGKIQVPDHLVVRTMAAGFTRHPLPSIEPETADAAEQPARVPTLVPTADPARIPPPPIDPTLSDDELLLRFTVEALDASYTESAAESIARKRLANLRAGGDGFSQELPGADGAAS